MAVIDVFPGDDLVTAVNGTSPGDVVNIHANKDGSKAVYDIGTSALTPANDVKIRGPFPRLEMVDSYRAVFRVYPMVHITGSGWNIFDLSSRSGNVIEGLEISGSKLDAADQLMSGKGIRGGASQLVRFCWLHDHENNAIGASWQGEVHYCWFTKNSIGDVSGISSAMKTTAPCRIEHCLFEDNYRGGPWFDCDSTDVYVGHTVVRNDVGTGIWVEISQGPATIENCLVENCNTGGVGGRGGIVIASSKNVTVRNCVLKDNGHSNMRVWEDNRFQNGSNGCDSGYYLENILVEGNRFIGSSGVGPRIIFNGQSTIFVSSDNIYDNPHESAPVDAQVVVSGLNSAEYPQPEEWQVAELGQLPAEDLEAAIRHMQDYLLPPGHADASAASVGPQMNASMFVHVSELYEMLVAAHAALLGES